MFQIKYGGLDDLAVEDLPSRRTRGKKINYQEVLASDSDEVSCFTVFYCLSRTLIYNKIKCITVDHTNEQTEGPIGFMS